MNKEKLYISATYYDGFSLYYIPADNVENPKFNDYEIKKCLNGGTPNMKNDTFSECNCPDNFIGPLCQYENLMHTANEFNLKTSTL